MKLLEWDQLDEKWFQPVVAPLADLKMGRGQATLEESQQVDGILYITRVKYIGEGEGTNIYRMPVVSQELSCLIYTLGFILS